VILSRSGTLYRNAGDCNGDGQVTIDELIAAVNVALGQADLSKCTSADANQDGSVTVDELIVAVNAAVEGCSSF